MKKIIISIVLIGFLSSVNQSYAASNPFFKINNTRVNFGKSLTLSWSVPKATECYLYSPTSVERNVPDVVAITGKKVSSPDAVHSDFMNGEKATYTLSCVDKTKLNKEGNYTQVYSKSKVVKLKKPKTLDAELTIYNSVTDESLLINPPKKLTQKKSASSIQLAYVFNNLNRYGSISLLQVDTLSVPGEGLQITGKKVSKRMISGLSGKVTEYDFQGMHYYTVQLSDGSRKYEVMVEVPISKVSSTWASVMQSLDTIRIISGKLDK